MPTQILRPNGAGSQEEIPFQFPDSSEHWDKVAEATPDDDTTYLYSASITELQDTLALENHPSLSGTIVSVTAYARCYSGNPNGRSAPGIKIGGITYRTGEQALGIFWHNLDPYQAFNNPNTGMAWTWDDINNLEVLAYQRSSVEVTEVRTTQVYVSVHYLPANVEVLRPNAPGDGGGLSFQDVDDVTPDEDTTMVYGTAYPPPPSNPHDLYNIENSSVGAGEITNVAVYGRFKDDAEDQWRKKVCYFWVKTGGFQERSGGYPQLGGWSDFHRNWNINPKTGVAWTWDDINALQIGISLFNPQRPDGDWIGKYSYCTQMWVEVTYEEPITAPTVTTNPATEVGQTTATLSGSLDDDGGEACECGFEYGETTDYGSTTGTQSKTTDEIFSQEVRGLKGGTVYHFRAIATNSAGTSYGADRTFHTEALSAEAHQALGKGYALGRANL